MSSKARFDVALTFIPYAMSDDYGEGDAGAALAQQRLRRAPVAAASAYAG